jgi:hypothetical protein
MERVVNWGKITKYAAALFAVQVTIGFLEGFFSPTGAGVVVLLVSAAASFALCGAVFAHLAARQPFKPFAHAWAALLLQVAAASVLMLVLTGWLGNPSPLMLSLEWLVLACALLAGTAFGSTLRQRAGQPADA